VIGGGTLAHADHTRNPGRSGAALAARGPQPCARAACALEAYRERRLSGYQLRSLLGIPSRYELDGFLKEHRIERYTREGFEQDPASLGE
jgi:hypothetical protein